MAVPAPHRAASEAARARCAPLLGIGAVQSFLKRRIRPAPPGPTAEQRARARSASVGRGA